VANAETEKIQEEDSQLAPEVRNEDERELTPMIRQPVISTAKMKLVDEEVNLGKQIAQDPHQSAKKLGLSQIIKYLELSKFKIEKCKNLTNGR